MTSLAMKPQANTESFGLLTRLFVALKRAGRVVDLVWLQQNADYALAVLDLAESLNDTEARETAARLRIDLKDFLAQAAGGARPTTARAPARTVEETPTLVERVGEPDTVDVGGDGKDPLFEGRYKTTLR